jgi:hypothetical protein
MCKEPVVAVIEQSPSNIVTSPLPAALTNKCEPHSRTLNERKSVEPIVQVYIVLEKFLLIFYLFALCICHMYHDTV